MRDKTDEFMKAFMTFCRNKDYNTLKLLLT